MKHRTQFPVFELTPRYVGIALGSVVGTTLAAAAALVAGSLVSDVATGALDSSAPAPALLGYLALSLAAQLATFGLTGWLPQRANLRREVDSSERAVDLVLHMPQRAFVRHEAGHYLNLVNMASFTHGCIVVATSTYVPGAMLSLAALLVFAALVDPTLAGVLALCALVYVPLSLLPSRAANRLQTRMMPMREAWLDEARRLVEERRAAVAAGAEGFYGRRYRERTESYRRWRRGYLLADTLSTSLPTSSGTLVQVIAVAACALLVATGRTGVGTVIAAWQLAGLLGQPMSFLCEMASVFAANRVNVGLLRELEREAAEPSGFERLRRTSRPCAVPSASTEGAIHA